MNLMNRYEEKYRGITFFINNKCCGLTKDCHKFLLGQYFSRFMTIKEMQAKDRNIKKINIRIGIDRLLAKRPIYSGNIRERS